MRSVSFQLELTQRTPATSTQSSKRLFGARVGRPHVAPTDAHCLYDEAIDLAALGRLTITRGSHVEPTSDGRWTADLSPVGGPLLGPFAWIIVSLDWEYNDQFTYEGDGVHPQPKVYLDQAAAEAECRRQCDEFLTETFPTPATFEPDWELFPNCDPETATWDDLRRDGFPDPYFLQEVEL